MEENNLIIDFKNIEKRIFTIRGKQVMIDRDLAELYAVQTKRINEQMKRNINRFPLRFCLQKSVNELNELIAFCDRFYKLKHSTSLPYAFTEQGVAMLSAVLKSEIAVNVSIQIIDAFVEMRKALNQNNLIDFRIYKIRTKTIILNDSHDRFLIIDEKDLYHIGAYLKDLGKKWFAFSKMSLNTFPILNRLKHI